MESRVGTAEELSSTMNRPHYSPEYIEHRKHGPFPGRIDPWSEDDYYFQQIHAGIVGNLLDQIQNPLEHLGYVAGREASLQIAERIEPDIFVRRAMGAPKPELAWDYELAAAEILAEVGVALSTEVLTQAIHIREIGSGRLVTVIEIVSPGNKTRSQLIANYRTRREKLLLDRQVNVVEIDVTRSNKRLIVDQMAAMYPYHIVIYLPDAAPRFIGIEFLQPLVRIALPLRGEVIPAELQTAYTYAYQAARIAVQAHENHFYREDKLPFPSLLTDAERKSALQTVETWKAELEGLRQS